MSVQHRAQFVPSCLSKMATPVDESTSGLEKWLQKELSKLLDGAPVGNDELK